MVLNGLKNHHKQCCIPIEMSLLHANNMLTEKTPW